MISKLDKKQIHNSFKGNNFTTQLFRNLFQSVISDHQLRIRIFKSFSHVNFITKNFYLPQFPMVMDQFSATEIFITSIRDLPRPRLIQKRRNLLSLLNGDAFYPLSTWPQDIQQLFWKKPFGNTDTFKLMLFFLVNGCSKHLVTEWILTSQHWTTLQKRIKRTRQIDFINNNLDSNANIWFYYDVHHST